MSQTASSRMAVTSQELLERAKKEVRKYAPAFDPDEMELILSEAEPGAYQYYWQAIIDGVRTGNSVFVGLNERGALCYLVCEYNLDAQPDLGGVRITEQQAREAAISFARLAPGQQINILLPIRVRECYLTYHPYFPDRLAWYVACDIQIYGGWQDSYWCYIDAASGDKNYDPYDPPIPRPVSG